IRGAIKSAVKWCILWFWNCVIKHLPEWVLTGGIVALAVYAMGAQQQVDYGYIASDELVHNWWINALSYNDMYVAGIYPMGFHCVIYYMNVMFGFPVAVLLRHFALVQYIAVVLMGTWFLQAVFKSRYLAFVGPLLYVNIELWTESSHWRFLSALPQEFGMIFLFPTLYFLLMGIKALRKRNKAKEKKPLKILSLLRRKKKSVDSGADTDKKTEEASVRKEKLPFRERFNPGTVVTRLASGLWKMNSVRGNLLLFAASLSMTISAHFYVTFFAAALCVGVVITGFYEVFRRGYFMPLFKAGILALFFALYPMVIAFAAGKPLQGSLYWALSVMGVDDPTVEVVEAEEEEEDDENAAEYEAVEAAALYVRLTEMERITGELQQDDLSDEDRELDEEVIALYVEAEMDYEEENGVVSQALADYYEYEYGEEYAEAYLAGGDLIDMEALAEFAGETASGDASGDSSGDAAYLPEDNDSLFDKAASFISSIPTRWNAFQVMFDAALQLRFDETCINPDGYLAGKYQTVYFWWFLAACFGLGVLISFGNRDYGRLMMTVAIGVFVIALMFCAGELGLPVLMENYRICIFMVYVACYAVPLVVDGALYLVMGFIPTRIPMRVVGLTGTLAFAYFFSIVLGLYPEPYITDTSQTNGAIICQESIRNNTKNYSWTIVSALDESRMEEGYGYHFEVIDLLEYNQRIGRGSTLYIPTATFFVFIEKVPIDYYKSYEDSGQSISASAAGLPLPGSSGTSCYQGQNRWIVMSKMYYWMESFKQTYPNAVTLYYEDDEFVCYRVDQNINSVYNLVVDYGFN
nr:hypothetical protein [Eubacterium sp.]